jgi:hypothetical protein
VSITTISISINEKVEQILAETTIWNLNQFRFSTSRRLESFLKRLISIRLKKN